MTTETLGRRCAPALSLKIYSRPEGHRIANINEAIAKAQNDAMRALQSLIRCMELTGRTIKPGVVTVDLPDFVLDDLLCAGVELAEFEDDTAV